MLYQGALAILVILIIWIASGGVNPYRSLLILLDSWRFLLYSVADVANASKLSVVIRYPFGHRTIIFSSRAAATHILTNGKVVRQYCTRFAEDSGLESLGMLHRGLIWNNDPASWELVRSFFQKGLSQSKLRTIPVLAQHIVNMVFAPDSLKPLREANGCVNVLNALRWVTLNFTLVVMLGLPERESWHSATELITAVVNYFKAWEFFLVRPKFWTRMSSQYEKHRAASIKLHKMCEELLELYETLRHQRKNNEQCILDLAYQAYEQKTISRDDLVQVILEALLAGIDTSSVTMFYTISFFVENPKCYKNVVKESESFQNDLIASSLPYLQACLRESMRLKPVGPIIMRRAAADDNVDGTPIYAGDQVIINVAAMNLRGFSPDDTFVFKPERFLDVETKVLPVSTLPFGHYPFGDGPKGCVGQHLAMREMQATLYYLLLKCQFLQKPSQSSTLGISTKWDIANQPQNSNEMEMFVLPRKFNEYSTMNVFLIGPHSTGKTYALRLLRNHFGDIACYHFEIARDLMKTLNISGKELDSNINLYLDLQKQLVNKYHDLQANIDQSTVHIFDRCAIDAVAYTALRGNPSDLDEITSTTEFQECLKQYKDQTKSLIVLFPIIPSLVEDDGTRIQAQTADEHEKLGRKYAEILEKFEIPFYQMSKNLKCRDADLISEIHTRLAR